MTNPADPHQPHYPPQDQGAWSQGAPQSGGYYQAPPPAETGGFYAAAPQPGYGGPVDPNGPGGAGPQQPGKPKGLLALVAALAVAVVGLGVGLVLSLNRSDSAGTSPTTVTVTSTAEGSGEITVTETVGDGDTVTETETVTETVEVEVGGGGGSEPTEGGEPPAQTGRIEGVVGEPLPLTFTDYDDSKSEFTLTLHTAEWADALEGEYVDPPKDTYLVLDVEFDVSSGTMDYSSWDWTAKDAEGHEYSDAPVYGSDLKLMSSGTAAAGEKVRGIIVFDLPKGETSLIYSQGFGDLGVSFKIPG